MEPMTFVLMGRTGSGKSSTGNSVIGRKVFKPGFSFTSTTEQCQLGQTTWKDGRILKVIDTPGLFDTNSTKSSMEFFQSHIAKCIELAKDGVHGVLYVISVKNRFTPEEAGILDSLQVLFGDDIINYVVLVFTGGDELENDDLTFQDYLNDCPPQLHGVVNRCNGRAVLFNNKTTSEAKKEEQTSKLMKQIGNIMDNVGGKPYPNEKLRQTQTNLENFLSPQTWNTLPGKLSAGEEIERMNTDKIKAMENSEKSFSGRTGHAKQDIERISAEQIKAMENSEKSFSRRTGHAKQDIERISAEQIKAMNCEVKFLQAELASEQAARKDAQEMAVKAIQLSKETVAEMIHQRKSNKKHPLEYLPDQCTIM